MRAQVFHGPGDLRFEEVPAPEPEPGGLVVRVEAALTCGTDVKVLRRGHPVMIPHVPTVFGHELAGTVEDPLEAGGVPGIEHEHEPEGAPDDADRLAIVAAAEARAGATERMVGAA